MSTFQEELGLPSVLFGVGLPDENAHAPNEKLDVGNFHGGIIASAYLYDEIARTPDSMNAWLEDQLLTSLKGSTARCRRRRAIRSRCSCGRCCRCTRRRASAMRRSPR